MLLQYGRANDYAHIRPAGQNGSVRRMSIRILCSVCEDTSDLVIKKLTCEQAFADRKFQSRGWQLGKTRGDDVCPRCMEKRRRRDRERTLAQRGVEVEISPTGEPVIARSELEFIRDYVRSQLDEVEGGLAYKPGQNDRAVAASLRTVYPTIRSKLIESIRFGLGPVAEPARKKSTGGRAGLARIVEQLQTQLQDLRKRLEDEVAARQLLDRQMTEMRTAREQDRGLVREVAARIDELSGDFDDFLQADD